MRREGDNHWEMVSSLVAIVVGCAALGITAYTAYLQRKQAQASVWPRLVFDDAGPDYHYVLLNKGVGPALIHDVQIRVDGKPVPTWGAVLQAIVKDPEKHAAAGSFATMNGAVLVAGENRSVAAFDDEIANPMRAARPRLAVTICYCSIFDQCWMFDDHLRQPSPIAECPATGPMSFNQ